MTQENKYKDECLKAWSDFEQVPYVDRIKITFIPEKPAPQDIANYGLPKKERKFKKVVPNVVFIEKIDESGNKVTNDKGEPIFVSRFEGHETYEQQDALLKQFTEWRRKGYWFYNGDNLEYITGDHWYYWNVVKIMIGQVNQETGELDERRDNPWFIDRDRMFFYTWRQVEIVPYCFGLLLLSGRRWGKTAKGLSILQNSSTWYGESLNVMQGQTYEFAKDTLFQEIRSIMREMPDHPYFKPIHQDLSDTIKFWPKGSNQDGSNTIKRNGVLYSELKPTAQTLTSADGKRIKRAFLDEVCKWTSVSVKKAVSILVETLAIGSRTRGKLFAATTAENLAGRTLPEFKSLWENSNLALMDDFSQTPSKLYRVFFSAALGYQHEPDPIFTLPDKFNKPTIDEWGYSDTRLATEIILYLRKKYSGDDLVDFVRKYPLTSEEALSFSQEKTPYDVAKLNQQLQYNDDIRVRVGDEVVRGDFEWVEYFKKVEFFPKPDGKWKVCWMPPPEDRNQYDIHMGVRRPTRSWVYAGVDPFDHKTTEESKFSNGAAASLCLGHPKGFPRKGFVCMYDYRPPTALLFYEDVLKQLMFYSSPCLAESQKYGFINWMNDHGFGGYIENNPLKPDQKNQGVSTRDPDMRVALINLMRSFVFETMGRKVIYDENDEILDEEWGHCPFDDFISNLLSFNPMDWTPSDLPVAAKLALLATERPEYAQAEIKINLTDWGFNTMKGR
jgi:hypothetical protein